MSLEKYSTSLCDFNHYTVHFLYSKEKALVVWADWICSWIFSSFPLFMEVKIGGRSQLKGEFIMLVPVRMSSLIRAAPEIPLTPISYYQSWKCSGPHLTLLFEQQSGAFWFVMPVIHGEWWFDEGTLMWWGRVIASTVYTKRTVWCGSLTWWRATV